MTLFSRLIKFFENFPFGVLLGFILGMLFAIYLGSDISASAKSNIVGIATAFGTLIAAGFATFGVIATIRQQEAHRQKERTDKLNAARSTLPLSLSKLTGLTEKGFRYAMETQGWDNEATFFPSLRSDLEIDNFTMANLKESIQYSDDTTAEWLSIFIAHYQVYYSRMLSRFNEKPLNFEDRCIGAAADWLLLKAILLNLFDYARGGQHPNQILEDRMYSYPMDLMNHPNQTLLLDKMKILREYYGVLNAQNLNLSNEFKHLIIAI